jgi:2,4-diaminopentanoate dehydrogenase
VVYRVIQWATGGVGRSAIAAIVAHPELELAGCWVRTPAKHGADAGELAGIGRLGVTASTDQDELLALSADCVVYAPLVPDAGVVAALLRSGKNVVTPVGWIYPDPARAADIDAACQAGGTTLHGTGIHPGGITERFPLMLSALSSAVTHVRAEEFSDLRTYNAPDVIRHVMGFGGTPDEALASPMAAMLGGGFKASVRMIVAVLGFGRDGPVHTAQEIAVASAPIQSPIGVIKPGQVAGRRFRWQAMAAGQPVVTAAVNWLMGEANLDPPWTFGPAGHRYEIEVTGDPSLLVTVAGLHPSSVAAGLIRNPSVVATANHCVSAIPYVCQAEPGIRTYLDLPLIAGRAAASVGRDGAGMGPDRAGPLPGDRRR